MPCIEIYTNLPNDRIPENFHPEVTEFFCGLLNKEPRGVVLSVYPAERISLGSDVSEECVVAQIYNAEEFLVADENKKFIKKVTDKFSEVFNIRKERISVLLLSMTSHTVCTPIGLLAERGPFQWRFKYLEDLKAN